METSDSTRINLLGGAPIAPESDLRLAQPAAGGGCCGGGSCMCGGGASAFDTAGARGLVAESTASHDDHAHGLSNGTLSSAASTEFLVSGMTCGHCVASVKEEVGALAGVQAVEVVLKKGGASRVTVTANNPLETEAVRAAVEEAGYQLV